MTDVRDRIIDSAYPLFATRGIRDVSVDELRAVSGVPPAEFDRAFRSRDELAAECVARWPVLMEDPQAMAGGPSAHHQPARAAARSATPGVVRSWWGGLTGLTRVVMVVNCTVIAGVGVLSAVVVQTLP